MWGREVLVAGPPFVDFDDYEAGEQGGYAEEVEGEVDVCAGALLGGGVGWLQD